LGVTNFNADHLHVLCREGYDIATNQVSFSLLDRRAAGDMAAVCIENNVKLLAYGTLCGGFLSSTWAGRMEPSDIVDWSKMKYWNFIEVAGGWRGFVRLVDTIYGIGARHGVSASNVATRWVLDHPHVGCAIVGARLTERHHRDDTEKLFDFELTDGDRAEIDEAALKLKPIPGDCGDEYRRPPYLTASGDLSHHLDSLPSIYAPEQYGPDRWRVSSGSVWESVCGFSRAVRVGNRVLVSGTTATHGPERDICKGDVRGQMVYCLDKIAAAIVAFGGSLDDVVRTRIYMADASCWEEASRVHGRYFKDVLPANTLIEISHMVGGYDIEVEAEAILSSTES
ncbi:MAG: aldo/keto reductase, partial [Pseudomonadota bacterium]